MLQSSTAAIVLVPLGQVAQAGAQAGLLQPGEQGRGGQKPQARRRELEGEGESVELSGDRGQGGCVVVGDRCGGAGGRGPVEQQGDGGRVGNALEGVVVRCGQRSQQDLVLGAHPERRPAGRHDDEVGAARHQVGQGGGRPGELLEVVEHEEHPQAPQVADQGVEGVGVGELWQAEGCGDPRDDECRLPDGGEVDGHRAGGERRPLPGEQLEGEPGLADASRPGDRHQPMAVCDQCAQLVDLGVAADQRCHRAGEREVGPPDAVCAPRSFHPPEPSLAGRLGPSGPTTVSPRSVDSGVGPSAWGRPRESRSDRRWVRQAQGRSREGPSTWGRGPPTPGRYRGGRSYPRRGSRPTPERGARARAARRHPGWGRRRRVTSVRRRRGPGRRRGSGRCAGRGAGARRARGRRSPWRSGRLARPAPPGSATATRAGGAARRRSRPAPHLDPRVRR